MKIKTWLLLSYLIVMILPLISAYILFASVFSYQSNKEVEEYYEAYAEIQLATSLLRDPALYESEVSKETFAEIESNHVSITLFNIDGHSLYSSHSDPVLFTTSKEVMYENLYELNQGLRTYTYKEPVFEDGNVVGVFEIVVAREAFIATVTKRGWIVTGLFIVSFIIIYAAIALIVNNRLNKRLVGLMDEMSAFASGDTYEETKTGKDEIGELKQHFYVMRKQINAAQEVIELEQKAKEYMVATISHDLKTPLTSIKAYAESLKYTEDLSEHDQAAYRKVIIEKSDFMKQMLDDLITHTLLQSTTYEPELVPVDGGEFFDMLISDYDPLCKKKEIALCTINQATGMYDVNPKQLIRVVDNLTMNAIQHTPYKGNLWIAALSEKLGEDFLYDFVYEKIQFDFANYVYIVVQNEGDGIPEEKINLLFDPLYQTDQARSKKDAHGTGLGLSIAKQIIELHGGHVYAFSELNVGASFICSIPKRKENDLVE